MDIATKRVKTVAGVVEFAWYNGDGILASTACLWYPEELYIRSDGDILIGDTTNNRVRQLRIYGPPSSQPTTQPTTQPSSQPSRSPTSQPTSNPSQPTAQPTSVPTYQPTILPTSLPSTVKAVN